MYKYTCKPARKTQRRTIFPGFRIRVRIDRRIRNRPLQKKPDQDPTRSKTVYIFLSIKKLQIFAFIQTGVNTKSGSEGFEKPDPTNLPGSRSETQFFFPRTFFYEFYSLSKNFVCRQKHRDLNDKNTLGNKLLDKKDEARQ